MKKHTIKPTLKWNHAKKPMAFFIFVHGYCFMDSEFMEYFTYKLQENSVTVIRFEFPFMNERRQTGTKKTTKYINF